jgi:zinc D-Ala-D-Ala carboxypeptidase
MEYKILIIKNRFSKKLNFKKGLDYFAEKTPLKIIVEEIETNDEIIFKSVGNATYSGVVPEHLPFKKYVQEGTYNAVVLVYGNDAPGIRVSITEDTPFYKDTDFISICEVSDGGLTLNHELFHAFFKKIQRYGLGNFDPMDLCIKDGKVIPYYNDKMIDAKESNRTIALATLNHLWDKVATLNKGFFQTIIDTVVPVTKPSKSNWKYFKLTEKTGSFGTVADLSPSLVDMLDKAREIAGIPFVITSGFRTVTHNKAVGGVSDSAHLKGLAVDLRCRNSNERYLLLNALLSVGFNRIGYGKTFLHADIDTTKPKNVIFDYDN